MSWEGRVRQLLPCVRHAARMPRGGGALPGTGRGWCRCGRSARLCSRRVQVSLLAVCKRHPAQARARANPAPLAAGRRGARAAPLCPLTLAVTRQRRLGGGGEQEQQGEAQGAACQRPHCWRRVETAGSGAQVSRRARSRCGSGGWSWCGLDTYTTMRTAKRLHRAEPRALEVRVVTLCG